MKVPLKYQWQVLILGCLLLTGCGAIKKTYRVGKGTVKGTVWAVKGAYKFTRGTTKIAYKIGKFTFEVVKAPLGWPLMNEEIETIDGLPVKEAIRQGRVKNSPYTVKGKRYYPMTVARAQDYEEVGIASWYGNETLLQKGGHMTANGEAFNPKALSAAHKHLPLPTNVMVTNLENGRSVIVRVNDRGPFPSRHNPRSGKRIIDLSRAAAKKLGFYRKGTARVRVKTLRVIETG
ncbi:MAG: septal ring lytic transglycosylase RlpA family protein [Nitrospinaceae bacterium]